MQFANLTDLNSLHPFGLADDGPFSTSPPSSLHLVTGPRSDSRKPGACAWPHMDRNRMSDHEYVIKLPELQPGEVLTLNPKPLDWERFEDEVAAHIRKLIKEGVLGVQENSCTVFQRNSYFSKAREANIIFDVAIEVRSLPDADTPLLILIWECKDYPNRNVGVDEVEEFAEKLRQVGAHKGTIVTRKGFQSGAEAVAKHYRIGLATLNKEPHCTVMFSRDAGVSLSVELTSPMAIDCSGQRWKDGSVFLEWILKRELDNLLTTDSND